MAVTYYAETVDDAEPMELTAVADKEAVQEAMKRCGKGNVLVVYKETDNGFETVWEWGKAPGEDGR